MSLEKRTSVVITRSKAARAGEAVPISQSLADDIKRHIGTDPAAAANPEWPQHAEAAIQRLADLAFRHAPWAEICHCVGMIRGALECLDSTIDVMADKLVTRDEELFAANARIKELEAALRLALIDAVRKGAP